MRIKVALTGDLPKYLREELARGEKAVSNGMRAAARGLEQELEGLTRSAGLGPLARAWSSKIYPSNQPSLGAAGLVYVKGKARTIGAIFAHSTGVIIRNSKGGRALAIPTDNVPRRRGGRGGGDRMSPAEVELAFNQDLIEVETKKGFALLVIKAVAAKSKRGFRAATKKRVVAGRETLIVPMFLLIPQATLRKRFDLDAPAQRWIGRLAELIVAEWNKGAQNKT